VTDASGAVVRNYSIWSSRGTATSTWDGKNNAGTIVPDGLYTLTYVPHDSSGATGDPVSVQVLVLTAIRVPKPSPVAFFARDGDALSRTITLKAVVAKPAEVGWKIVDGAGNVVRAVRAPVAAPVGTLSFAWNGKTDAGAWAPDGWYRSVVTATTSDGTYSQSRSFYAGAFRVTPSINSPVRGGSVTLTIVSTEALMAAPVVHVTQPGLDPWDVTSTLVNTRTYRVTVQLVNGGDAGTLLLDVAGVDKYGGTQDTTVSLSLR
jgi:flagellar hook assembly protein FlgD